MNGGSGVDILTERAAVAAALEGFCLDNLPPGLGVVGEAVRYSLLGAGKRLRALLMGAAYRAAGGTGDPSELGAAIEVVHAYSLVHDDLPCMDDDDMRRGRPTVHREYGVAAATAAGLAMVPLAARCAMSASLRLGLPPETGARIVGELMRASGAGGMIGGQLLDLEGEGLSLSLEELEKIHCAKTGELIAASVAIGGIAGGADGERLDALSAYGAAVGLAFQIADDVLDVTATTDELGKTAGRDNVLRKSTYPAVLGVEGAILRAGELVDEACDALRPFGLLTPELEGLARYVVARRS